MKKRIAGPGGHVALERCLSRFIRAVDRLRKELVPQSGRLERMLRYQREILDELPDIVRDEIASRPRGKEPV